VPLSFAFFSKFAALIFTFFLFCSPWLLFSIYFFPFPLFFFDVFFLFFKFFIFLSFLLSFFLSFFFLSFLLLLFCCCCFAVTVLPRWEVLAPAAASAAAAADAPASPVPVLRVSLNQAIEGAYDLFIESEVGGRDFAPAHASGVLLSTTTAGRNWGGILLQ
jgi:hypothetical protein